MKPVAAVERLGVIMQPTEGELTEAWGVLNPAAARGRDGQLYLFARVVAEGNYSRVRMTRVIFDEAGTPVDLERLGFILEPFEAYECNGSEGGCEDPRVTFISAIDKYVMAYTAFGSEGPRIALAVSDDLFRWTRLGRVHLAAENGVDFDSFDNKDGFFFPDPVMGPDGSFSLAFAHRPVTGAERADRSSDGLRDLPPSIWVSYTPLSEIAPDPKAMLELSQHHLLIRPEFGWEHLKVGGGPPPVLTPCGWLLLYHGIEDLSPSPERCRLRYSAGAFIVDRWDVRRVVWRSPDPLLVPDTAEELHGVVDNVVFPTGIDRRSEDTFDVYYGMADSRIGVARVWISPDACEDGVVEAA